MSMRNLMTGNTKTWLDLKVDTITATGVITSVGLASDTLVESTTDAGVIIETNLIKDGKISIGSTSDTFTIGSFKITGKNDDVANGPGIELLTDWDNYPLMHIAPIAHDNIMIMWDCHQDGVDTISDDVGSNFIIQKLNDTINWVADHANVKGTTLSAPETFMSLDIGSTRTLSNFNVRTKIINLHGVNNGVTTDHAVYLDAAGNFGKATCLRAHKSEIEDITCVDKFYELKPKKFRRKILVNGEPTEELTSYSEYGFIAEDCEEVDDIYASYYMKDGEKTLDGIRNNTIFSMAVKAIHDQKEIIDLLVAEVSVMRAEINVLKLRVL